MTNPARFSSLCRPDAQKSCFGCCPPIRPAGYDHLDHALFLRRELAANTQALKKGPPTEKIITGYVCWGLGFLDADFRLIGCLLHPARHAGQDLRDLTGYGPKCRRELCAPARLFEALPQDARASLLSLGQGLDSFAYSSPRANPIFRLLAWGKTIVLAYASAEPGGQPPAGLAHSYPGLLTLTPAAHAFLLELALEEAPLAWVCGPGPTAWLAGASRELSGAFQAEPQPTHGPLAHQLGLPPSLVRLVKLGLHRQRVSPGQARRLEAAARELVSALVSSL